MYQAYSLKIKYTMKYKIEEFQGNKDKKKKDLTQLTLPELNLLSGSQSRNSIIVFLGFQHLKKAYKAIH